MGLFTSPVTLDTDRIFEKRGQIFDKKGVTVVEYIEPAAALSAESLLTIKHDDSGSVKRHLLQRTIKRVRTNVSGVLNTCKSNEKVSSDMSIVAHG